MTKKELEMLILSPFLGLAVVLLFLFMVAWFAVMLPVGIGLFLGAIALCPIWIPILFYKRRKELVLLLNYRRKKNISSGQLKDS